LDINCLLGYNLIFLAAALGVPNVRIYQDNLFWKFAGQTGSSWHQDSAAAVVALATRMVTIWMPLQETANTMGCLQFGSGSHRNPVKLWNLARKRSKFDREHVMQVSKDISSACDNEDGKLGIGDVSIHLGWTAHGSDPNSSDKDRNAIAIQYVPDGTEVQSDFRSQADYKENSYLRDWLEAAQMKNGGEIVSDKANVFMFNNSW